MCAPVVRRNGHPRKNIGNRSRGKYVQAYICVHSLDKLIQEPENIGIASLIRLPLRFNFKPGRGGGGGVAPLSVSVSRF